MNPLLTIDGSQLTSNITDFLAHDFKGKFNGPENAPNLFAELSVVDMMRAVSMCKQDARYREGLILKGGHSVRSYVPLVAHRFSYDLDFNINQFAGYKFRDIERLRIDLNSLSDIRRSAVRAIVVHDDNRFFWVEMNYRETIEDAYGVTIPERPKIEICKACRTYFKPVERTIPMLFDLSSLDASVPVMRQLEVSEQLANKLYVIGVPARQRRHFDIFDAYRMSTSNAIDWNSAQKAFALYLRGKPIKEYTAQARKLIQSTKTNTNTITRIESASFDQFDFAKAAVEVSALYSNLA